MKRTLIFIHRWLGVVLCLFFLLWFPSAIGMMYWDFPSVTNADRLARSPALEPARIVVSPAEAYASLGRRDPPAQARLVMYDGRPAYRFRAGRPGNNDALVYADTGERQGRPTLELLWRLAAAWAGQPAGEATIEEIDVDQWTVQGSFRELAPLWKYAWPDGQQVYLSLVTGEVVQYTTTASRIGAYLGPIPHWLYFTPLRKHQLAWTRVVIWSSGIGTVAALLGLVIGVWMYSPSRRFRIGGAPSSFPYQGQKLWHAMLGLIFGVGAVTWAFSGMLSMDPFSTPRASTPADVSQALRGPLPLSAFADHPPREALAQLVNLQVKELELAVAAGEPVYIATLASGETRIVPLDGPPRRAFDRDRISALVKKASGPDCVAEIHVLDQYDLYYLDRRRQRPLPVILVQLNDEGHTRLYIDPKTVRIAGSYNSRGWMSRWLYHLLHSLDFPWLYNHRPLWDIVVIVFMLGGTGLCVTSLVLAWRVIGRTLTHATL
ncbi:MAG: PepSY domain-containing protein [Acidobacteria bacterium]|nr:PepSY domain-containing protein [Acidobacteriota bacterium]